MKYMLHNAPPVPLSVSEIAFFENAIHAYTQAVEKSSSIDLMTLNNRGVCKLTIGIATSQQQLIDSAIEDFITVIMLGVPQSLECVFAKNSMVLARKANDHLSTLRAG